MRGSTARPTASAALCAVLALLCIAAGAPSAGAETCPNEARRAEQGEAGRALPECRAYELVSPPDSQPRADAMYTDPVSVSGDRFAFTSEYGLAPGFTGGHPFYVSTRGPSGWSTDNEMPPQSTSSGLLCIPYIAGYSADLSQAVLADGWSWTGYPNYPDENGAENCGHDEPLLSAGEPLGAQNIFLHPTGAPNEAGFYRLLNPTPPGLAGRDAYFRTGSADFSHIVFTSPLQLTPEAPLPPEQVDTYAVGEDLYENVGGALRLLTVLPGGAPTWGILANSWASYATVTSSSFTHAVSEDGERVFFYGDGELFCGSSVGASCDSLGAYRNSKLYLRQNAAQQPAAGGECSAAEAHMACTAQVDEPNSDAPPGPGGGGMFQSASADGSRVFFTDCARLTADSTAVSSSGGCGGFAKTEPGYQQLSGNDLYEYDLEKPVGQRLTDLTVDPNGADVLGADVQGVAGISKGGSYVYFVARGVLSGEEENEHHEKATAGESNLYLSHGGATTFLATLGPPIGKETALWEPESCDWSSAKTPEWGALSPDPRSSPSPCLTSRVSSDGRFLAFNSRRPLTGYDNTVAATGKPSYEIFLYDAATSELSCASCDPDGSPPTAANGFEQPTISKPWRTGESWLFQPALLSGQLSDRGQLFFDTTNALLPADVNGARNFDVYEYAEGQLRLISTGTSDTRSIFRGASPDGSNVFFTTGAGLVAADIDSATSVYDARVGGGFPEPPPPVVCESEEACHLQHQQPPATSTPGTAHFEGPVNPRPLVCRKSFRKVVEHSREACVRAKRHKKHRTHRRHARRGRGGSR